MESIEHVEYRKIASYHNMSENQIADAVLKNILYKMRDYVWTEDIGYLNYMEYYFTKDLKTMHGVVDKL